MVLSTTEHQIIEDTKPKAKKKMHKPRQMKTFIVMFVIGTIIWWFNTTKGEKVMCFLVAGTFSVCEFSFTALVSNRDPNRNRLKAFFDRVCCLWIVVCCIGCIVFGGYVVVLLGFIVDCIGGLYCCIVVFNVLYSVWYHRL